MAAELSDTDWDELQQALGASFLQSSGWAQFQAALGVHTVRLSGEGWSALCLQYKTPVGMYWYLPYGPTTRDAAAFKQAMQAVKHQAKQAGVSWVRIEPPTLLTNLQKLEPAAVRSPQHLNPEYTIYSSLDEDEAAMRTRLTPNKRNLINRGTTRGLQFEISANPADITIFTDMLHVVEARTGAHSHSDGYYATQAKVLMPLGVLTLNIARGPEGNPLATTVLLSYAGVTSRVYAASYPEARKYEAGVGLDWYTILAAKAAGIHGFDFYGAAPPDAGPEHPFAGFTKYKREFGGEYLTRSGTWDVPLSLARYKLYLALRRVKR